MQISQQQHKTDQEAAQQRLCRLRALDLLQEVYPGEVAENYTTARLEARLTEFISACRGTKWRLKWQDIKRGTFILLALLFLPSLVGWVGGSRLSVGVNFLVGIAIPYLAWIYYFAGDAHRQVFADAISMAQKIRQSLEKSRKNLAMETITAAQANSFIVDYAKPELFAAAHQDAMAQYPAIRRGYIMGLRHYFWTMSQGDLHWRAVMKWALLVIPGAWISCFLTGDGGNPTALFLWILPYVLIPAMGRGYEAIQSCARTYELCWIAYKHQHGAGNKNVVIRALRLAEQLPDSFEEFLSQKF
jgi:hypothetical protein